VFRAFTYRSLRQHRAGKSIARVLRELLCSEPLEERARQGLVVVGSLVAPLEHERELSRREILPRLRSVNLSEITDAAGCSKAPSDIRRGNWAPHVSAWPALAELVGLLACPLVYLAVQPCTDLYFHDITGIGQATNKQRSFPDDSGSVDGRVRGSRADCAAADVHDEHPVPRDADQPTGDGRMLQVVRYVHRCRSSNGIPPELDARSGLPAAPSGHKWMEEEAECRSVAQRSTSQTPGPFAADLASTPSGGVG